ncbi:sigma-54 interaction domain-containing protein [Rosettibacter firmus]|uniref:sigma-54 interaction domain-containing protein n=1 Tax=Rosettibacter firmus TaxID=3111522 RepID=UPI00336BFAF2
MEVERNIIIGKNKKILEIIDKIDKIAQSDCSILLIGETGVGKELFAEYIHKKSNRSHYPLVKVSLSTLPPNLIESELFGYEKGAFTGSLYEKKGLFEIADKGTIYLDDIDDFPLELQPKLLRVIENKEIKRIGAQNSIPLDIRLITSSKIDLSKLVTQEKFRMDLFFRINVFPIEIPPLRERKDDIPLLVDYFLKLYEPNKPIEISEAALEALQNYSWPGNVRELKNIIQRIVLFTDGKVTLDVLPNEIKQKQHFDNFIRRCISCFENKKMNFEEVIKCVETQLLQQALKISEGNRTHAARLLGLSLSTLRDKLKKYNLD